MAATFITLSSLAIGALAAAEPAVTAAAMLDPRQLFPAPDFVGYISGSSGCKCSLQDTLEYRSLTLRETTMLEDAITLKSCRPPAPSHNAVRFPARVPSTQHARPTRFWPLRAVLCRAMSTQASPATPLYWRPLRAPMAVLRTWLVGSLRWDPALSLSCKTSEMLVSFFRAIVAPIPASS